MPTGVRVFLVYAFGVLVIIGLSLRFVIDMAISAPVSLPGVLVMILLAYTIFTITLVLQRKLAARGLALGLASLTLPAVPLGFFSFTRREHRDGRRLVLLGAGASCFRGLLRPEVRGYFDQP